MNEFIVAAGGCLLAGVMTTLHPCPVTTNMASISLLIGWTTKGRRRGLTLFSFVTGYLLSYLLLAILLSSGSISIPRISNLLQVLVHLFMGPSLILIGMLLADLLNLNRLYHGRILSRIRSENWSGISAFPFGFIVALSFCPATAVIFFGILVPLAVDHHQRILFPVIYAVGASAPLITISALMIRGVHLSRNSFLIRNLPTISGWILIGVGVVLTIQRIYLS
jgi:cytochrome c-type biogenesis protein